MANKLIRSGVSYNRFAPDAEVTRLFMLRRMLQKLRFIEYCI